MVNGENYGGAWIMDAKGAPTWLPLSSLPGTWDLWEAKNLNGDQFADILLYDDTNKDIGAWLLNASGVPAWQSLGKLTYDSTLITACDLNGDGIDDLRFRDGDTLAVYRVYEDSTRWQVIGDVPSNWRTDLGGLA